MVSPVRRSNARLKSSKAPCTGVEGSNNNSDATTTKRHWNRQGCSNVARFGIEDSTVAVNCKRHAGDGMVTLKVDAVVSRAAALSPVSVGKATSWPCTASSKL